INLTKNAASAAKAETFSFSERLSKSIQFTILSVHDGSTGHGYKSIEVTNSMASNDKLCNYVTLDSTNTSSRMGVYSDTSVFAVIGSEVHAILSTTTSSSSPRYVIRFGADSNTNIKLDRYGPPGVDAADLQQASQALNAKTWRVFGIDFSSSTIVVNVGSELLLKYDDASNRIKVKYVSFYNAGATTATILYCNREDSDSIFDEEDNDDDDNDDDNDDDDDDGGSNKELTCINAVISFLSKIILGDFAGQCISDLKLCTQGITVGLWFYINPSSTGVQTLLSSDTASPGIQIYFDANEVHVVVHDSSSKYTAKLKAKKSVWHHVTVSWHPLLGMNMMMDFNSKIQATASVLVRLTDVNTLLTLGAKNDLTGSADASVSSLVIWEKALELYHVQKIGICADVFPEPALPNNTDIYRVVPYDLIKTNSDKGNTVVQSLLNYNDGMANSAGWQPLFSTGREYIQLDFVMGRTIARIATQGGNNHAQWVKTFTMSYSLDGMEWTYYQVNGSVYHFQANSDSNSIVSHQLCATLEARLVRVYPSDWNTSTDMRVGVFYAAEPFLSKGCYSSDVLNVSKPSNDINSDDMHPGMCVTSCGLEAFTYAGVSVESRCYCFNGFPSNNDVSKYKCNEPCKGNPAFMCGSQSHVSIYEVRETLNKKLTVSVPSSIRMLESFKVTSANHHRFWVDFGDGITLRSNTSEITYFSLGEQDRMVLSRTWVGKYGEPKELQTTNRLAVDWWLLGSKLSFATIVEAEIPYIVNITVNEGKEITLTHFASNSPTTAYSIPDSNVYLTSSNAASLRTSTSGPTGLDRVYLLTDSVFKSGLLKAFAVDVASTGYVKIQIFRPVCILGGDASYCYASGNCSSSVAKFEIPVDGLTCKVINQNKYIEVNETITFKANITQGTNPMVRYDFGDGTMNITREFLVNKSFPYWDKFHGNITVYNNVSSKKCFLVFKVHKPVFPINITQISTNDARVSTPSAFMMTISSGNDYICDWDFGNGVVRRRGSNFSMVGSHVFYTYNSSGWFYVKVNCTNRLYSGYGLTIARAYHPITKLILSAASAQSLERDYSVSFRVELGTNVTYNLTWTRIETSVSSDINIATISADTTSGSTIIPKSYFPTIGVYRFAFYAINEVTPRLVITHTIRVEIPIRNFCVNSSHEYILVNHVADLHASVDTGSNVIVYWDFRDGVSQSRLHKADTLRLSSDHVRHSYSDHGVYEVHIRVANPLGSKVIVVTMVVQYPVKELRLTTNSPQVIPPGLTWFDLTVPNGIHVPTNATIDVDYEYNGVHRKLLFGTANISRFSKIIITPGIYFVNMNVSNQISWQKFNTSIDVQREIKDFRVTPVHTTGADAGFGAPGRGPGNNVFPREYPIRFNAATSNGSNVTFYYTFGDISSMNVTQDYNVMHLYDSKGEYEINVTANNSISEMKFSTRIILMDSNLNLTFNSDSPSKFTSKTTFHVQLSQIGNSACCLIDLTNNTYIIYKDKTSTTCRSDWAALSSDHKIVPTKHNISIVFPFTFWQVIYYYVKMTCHNTVSYVEKYHWAIIVPLSCDFPQIYIKQMGRNFENPRKFRRSEHIKVYSDVSIYCYASRRSQFQWNIYKLNSTGHAGAPFTDLSKGSKINRSILELPQRSLPYGLYMFKLNVSIVNLALVDTVQQAYGEVMPSPLQCYVYGGNGWSQSIYRDIVLDGQYSYDPDQSEANKTDGIEYYLYCKKNDANYTLPAHPALDVAELASGGGGCLTKQAGFVTKGKSIKTYENRTFQVNDSLHFRLYCTKGSRLGFFDAFLKMTEVDPPQCALSMDGLTLNRRVITSSKITIQAKCQLWGQHPTALNIEWFLFKKNNIGEWDTKDLADVVQSPTNRDYLVLRKDCLQSCSSYMGKIVARIHNGPVGYTYIFLNTHCSPRGGKCSVFPEAGISLTPFHFTCGNWTDYMNGSNLHYYYYYKTKPYNLPLLFEHTDRSSTRNVTLPEGDETFGYYVEVKVLITDMIGAITTTFLKVKIKPDQSASLESPCVTLHKEVQKNGHLVNLEMDDNSRKEGGNEGRIEGGWNEEGGKERGRKEGGRRKEEGGRRKEEGGRRKEEGGRRKEEGGRRKEEGGRRKEGCRKRKIRERIATSMTNTQLDSINTIQMTSATIFALAGNPEEQCIEVLIRLVEALKSIVTFFLQETVYLNFDDVRRGMSSFLQASAGVLHGFSVLLETASTGNASADSQNKELAKFYTAIILDSIRNTTNIIKCCIVANEYPTRVFSPELNVTLSKNTLDMPHGLSFYVGSGGITLPDGFISDAVGGDLNDTTRLIDIESAVYLNNPFTGDNTSNLVKSMVCEFGISNSTGSISLQNLTNPIELWIHKKGSLENCFQGTIRYHETQHHMFSVLRNESSINIDVRILDEISDKPEFAVALGKGKRPDSDEDDWYNLPENASPDQAVHTVFYSSKASNNTMAGEYIVAVKYNRMLSDREISEENGNKALNYSFCAYTSECIYWHTVLEKWTAEGCEIGVIPIPSNDPRDMFGYEVCFYTGFQAGNGTTAQVSIILSGSMDETQPRVLQDIDGKRKLFRRGEVDSFLVTTPYNLGQLGSIKLWHNHGGDNPSWFLSRLYVRDLQTDTKTWYICNRWFAVEEDDGKIERVLHTSTNKELTSFNLLFASEARKNFSDSHLWLSVYYRPPNSTFTRVQRITCCICILLSTMLANALFYQTGGNTPNTEVVIGPFRLSTQQISIAITSSLVVLPINLIIMTIFRKARIKNHPGEEKTKRFFKEESQSETGQTIDEVQDEHIYEVISMGSDSEVSKESEKSKEGNNKKNNEPKKSFMLPYWSIYIAYVLAFLTCAVSTTFTIFYSLTFGKEKSEGWLSAMMISFWQDVLISQPIKVLALAVIFAIIVKDPNKVDDGTKRSAELGYDEEWIHRDPDSNEKVRLQNFIPKPPGEDDLYECRQILLKRKEMKAIIKEIVVYFIYLMVLCTVAYGGQDPQAFQISQATSKMFYESSYAGSDTLDSVSEPVNFWKWFHGTLIPTLNPSYWYGPHKDIIEQQLWTESNVKRKSRRGWKVKIHRRVVDTAIVASQSVQNTSLHKFPKTFIADRGTAYVIGSARLRQLRVRPATYSWENEDEGAYRPSWITVNKTLQESLEKDKKSSWVWRTAWDLQGSPYWGRFATYWGGGYVANIDPSRLQTVEEMQSLELEMWIDRYTRAVFTEFALYNAYTNFFCIVTMLSEIIPTGGYGHYVQFRPIRLYRYTGPEQMVIMAFEIVYIIFLFMFTYSEFKELYKRKKKYFEDPWNYLEILVIVLSFSAIGLYFARLVFGKFAVRRMNENPGDFISFTYVLLLDECQVATLGFAVFFAILKSVRLLRFNRRMSLLTMTVKACVAPLLSFFFMFVVVFLAYVQFAFIVFGPLEESYSSFTTCLSTMMSMTLGGFDFQTLMHSNPILGALFFFSYMIFVFMILVNVFLSIINDALAEVKGDVELQSNDYEIMDFVVHQIKTVAGIRVGPVIKPLYKKNKTQFHLDVDAIESLSENIEYALVNTIVEDQRQTNWLMVENMTKKKLILLQGVLRLEEDYDEDDLANLIPLMEQFLIKHSNEEVARKVLGQRIDDLASLQAIDVSIKSASEGYESLKSSNQHLYENPTKNATSRNYAHLYDNPDDFSLVDSDGEESSSSSDKDDDATSQEGELMDAKKPTDEKPEVTFGELVDAETPGESELTDTKDELVDAEAPNASELADTKDELMDAETPGESELADTKDELMDAEAPNASELADTKDELVDVETPNTSELTDTKDELVDAEAPNASELTDTKDELVDAEAPNASELTDTKDELVDVEMPKESELVNATPTGHDSQADSSNTPTNEHLLEQ
ncbi:hypothetical protein QZH41_011561, partial [Actinostola sp. cb2023]